jgi:6-phosphogluconate dehydrogenase
MKQAAFGIIGLGTMGRNLLLNLASHNINTIGFDIDTNKQELLATEAKDIPVQIAISLQQFVDQLIIPRCILLMVPAGNTIDTVLNNVSPLLQAGDIIIDGGNTYFKDTDRRIQQTELLGIHYIGMGISGGEKGARFGPSLMPGNNKAAYITLKHLLEKIAAKTNDGACVTYIGNGSAGHFVKMVHNGIEYAIMQLISEVYAILKYTLHLSNREINTIFTNWNNTELHSYLIEITANIFLQHDTMKNGYDLVDSILDKAAQKGTGMWTSNAAFELQVPTPTINAAVTARDISAYKNERTQIATYKNVSSTKNITVEQLNHALYVGMAASYVQGLHVIAKASEKYNYEVNITEVVRIWKGGCIIRAALLNEFQNIFEKNTTLPNALLDKSFYTKLAFYRTSVIATLQSAMDNAIGMPCLSSSLTYIDMFSTERLPANLIQAQRDYFGAHTYERIDTDGNFHTNWL